MYLKKRLAILLAIVMTIGSCFTAFAADPVATSDSVEGDGYSYDHVDREIWTCTLPTTNDKAASPFDFVVDPERLVNDAKTLGNNWEVTPNDDGVYFYHNVSANIGPSSNSLTVSGQNSVSVDVIASVTLGAKQANEIAVVSTWDEALTLSANNTPALLLNLSVSGQNVPVEYNKKVEKTVTINGVPDNFRYEALPNSDPALAGEPSGFPAQLGQFTYRMKTAEEGFDATKFETVTVSLNGKVNRADVPTTGLAVPKINVTYSFKKSGETGPKVTITPGGTITITGLSEDTDPTDMNLIDLTDNNHSYNLTSQGSTWTATGSAASGTITVKLGQAWFDIAGHSVKISLDLKDGSNIYGTTVLGSQPD